jgi:hypothetical protein
MSTTTKPPIYGPFSDTEVSIAMKVGTSLPDHL